MSFRLFYPLILFGCTVWLINPAIFNLGLTTELKTKGRAKKRNENHLSHDNGIANLTAEELACYQLPESIAAFTEAVRNQTETTALTTWTSTSKNENKKDWTFPQLDKKLLDSAFADRRVAIVGDSTTVLTHRWMYRLLSPALSSDFVQSLTRRNLTRAYHTAESHLYLTSRATFQNEENEFMAPNGAHVLRRGFHRPNQDWNCEFDDMVWPDIVQHKPHILLVNWGLHMFFRERASLCNVEQFVHYESYFMERVLKIAQQVGSKLVLFKTTNRICNTQEQQDRVRENHKRLCNATLWQWKENATTSNDTKHHFIPTSDEIDDYCRNGSMSEVSVETLNQRLERYIQTIKQQYPNMTVAVYNDHDMESCAFKAGPTDGLHYHILQLPRVRLLAHLVRCLYPREDN